MSIFAMFKRKSVSDEARTLYERCVEQARQPVFYAAWSVPDTPQGRFELVALHAFLLMQRLRDAGSEAGDLSQQVFDFMFTDMDESLRELGAGDLGVGRRVKHLAQGFYGRIRAYENGLKSDDGRDLSAALQRNLYGTVPISEVALLAMADYLRREAASLAGQSSDDLLAGRLRFGPPPAAPGGSGS